MDKIATLAELEGLYGPPSTPALAKVTPHLIATYGAFVARARFCVLSTVGAGGTDGSPRGDEGPVATILDPQTLALPDWRGNNRLDTLRNIVTDGRVSLLFLIPGSSVAIRVNGTAILTTDATLRQRFARGVTLPATVIVVTIAEVYSQCARAILRSALWAGEDLSSGLPSVGDMLAEITRGGIDGAAYDADWPHRAKGTMW